MFICFFCSSQSLSRHASIMSAMVLSESCSLPSTPFVLALLFGHNRVSLFVNIYYGRKLNVFSGRKTRNLIRVVSDNPVATGELLTSWDKYFSHSMLLAVRLVYNTFPHIKCSFCQGSWTPPPRLLHTLGILGHPEAMRNVKTG